MQIASKYHVSESMNLIPGCNKKTPNCGLPEAQHVHLLNSSNLKWIQGNNSLEVDPDTLCKATHTTSSSKIPLGLHQYIPDIFGRIRCDFWNLLIVNMVILWDTLNNFISQEKRLYDAKAPTTWTISTFTTKSSICRTSLIASNNQTESVNLTTVAYIVCGLPSLSPFFLLHARLSKENGWFSLLLCELISCNMIQGSPAVLAQQ